MGGFDWSSIASSLPFLMNGLSYTVRLTVVAAIGGTLWGILLALARLSGIAPLAWAAAAYVNLMRSVPLLLVIFWFYFLVPVMLQSITGAAYPPKIGPDRSAYVTFILFEGAYFCEIVRAGIQSIPKGQLGAAYAIGLNYAQAMRLVILPQALRNMLPVLLTQTIVLFQDVSLVALLNVTDLVGAAVKVAQRDSRLVEMYTLVAVVYFVLSYALSLGVKALNRRIAIIR
jgi:glutamate/aspartate transport system permease protein